VDFFGAGSETVRTTSDWAMLLMAQHQDVQQQIQEELDTVVGRDRQVAWSDRRNLPYCSAAVLEVQRWASVVTMNLPRMANADCVVAGQPIPKGTTVFINFWSVHHDPERYANPSEFNPYHFFDAKQNQVIKREDFVPFSAGKRDCIGRSLAEVELFLYLTSIVQKFKVEPIDNVKLSFEKELGATLAPVKSPVLKFTERF